MVDKEIKTRQKGEFSLSEILKKCVDIFSVLSLVFLVGVPVLWGVGAGISDEGMDRRSLDLLWRFNVFMSMFAIIWLPIRFRQSINKWLLSSNADEKILNVRFMLLLMVLVGLLRGFVYLVRN